MKRVIFLVYSGFSLFLILAGCQDTGKTAKEIDLVFQDRNDFARALAGAWQAEDSPWEIAFAPDGTLSSAVIPLGKVRIRPNKATKVKGYRGEPGIFQAGSCPVYLEPQSRQISIQIPMERVYAQFASSSLDGTCQYFIEGEMAKNSPTLFATVYTLLKLNVYSNEPNATTGRLEKLGMLDNDPNNLEDESKQLIFTKIKKATGKDKS
jgi:hypothetical protein